MMLSLILYTLYIYYSSFRNGTRSLLLRISKRSQPQLLQQRTTHHRRLHFHTRQTNSQVQKRPHQSQILQISRFSCRTISQRICQIKNENSSSLLRKEQQKSKWRIKARQPDRIYWSHLSWHLERLKSPWLRLTILQRWQLLCWVIR